MGNQESIIDNKYELKKKSIIEEKHQNIEAKEIHHHKKTLKNKNQNHINNSHLQNNRNINKHINKHDNKYDNKYEDSIDNTHVYNHNNVYLNHNTNKIPITNPNINNYKRLHERQYNNELLLQRNILSNLHNNNRPVGNIFDYPSSSNNELDEPKKNFDNIKFTPYDMNDTKTFDNNHHNNNHHNNHHNNNHNNNHHNNNHNNNHHNNHHNNNHNNNHHNNNHNNNHHNNHHNNIYDNDDNNNYNNNYKTTVNNTHHNIHHEYDPWKILGIQNKSLDKIVINKAYKKCALKYHPDKAGKKYEDLFQEMKEAHRYLIEKSEQHNYIEEKTKKPVINMDYEDINDNMENIYISKDKFDINKFNEIFSENKLPTKFDKGYSNMYNENINETKNKYSNNYNKDSFNEHFENIKKNNKKSTDIIEYNEPMALESSLSNLNQFQYGMDDIDDFGAVNSNNGLSYTDYKRAHVDETMLIDPSSVKYKSYKNIEQLESDRSNITYQMDANEKKRYEMMEKKREEDNQRRLQLQMEYDMMVEKHYNKLNRKMIINK